MNLRKIPFTLTFKPVAYNLNLGERCYESSEWLNLITTLKSTLFLISEVGLEDYSGRVFATLKKSKKNCHLLYLAGGEGLKTREMKAWVEDRLFALGADRDSTLIAIGGGALLDLIGFTASTYCRGIAYITFPTTLLAMTDVCIGGKTGVNLELAKNFVGTLYHPKAVFIDLSVLMTLPEKAYRAGLMETVKHALVGDPFLLHLLKDQKERILKRESSALLTLIEKSCFVKKLIVEADATEVGRRALLNYGHTFGHALEGLSHFSLLHGEAVALGLAAESFICLQKGLLKEEELEELLKLIHDYLPDLKCPILHFSDLLSLMKQDKKAQEGVPYFSLIKTSGIGNNYLFTVDQSLILQAFEWLKSNF
jgi:3-dehydroquinate synthase